MPSSTPKIWIGEVPEKCDICHCLIHRSFVDGKTKQGPWAIMCQPCLPMAGVGLGSGKGQLYRRDADGNYVKQEYRSNHD